MGSAIPSSRRRATWTDSAAIGGGQASEPGSGRERTPASKPRRGRRVTQGVPRQPGQAMQGGHGVRALPLSAHLPVRGQTGLQEGEQLLVLAAETEAHRIFDHDQIQLSRELRPCCGRIRVCRVWARLCCGGDRRAGNRGLARLGWDPIGQEGVRERSAIPRIRRPAAATPGAS